jgi:hypothetical protein
MIRSIPRAVAAALFGALAGPVCLVFAYAMKPDVGFAIDNLPPTTSGFYPAEREGTRYFVWTSRRADITLAGLDRRSEWSCSVRFRGARAGTLPQPDLDVAVDGVTLATRRATNDFQEVSVTAPARPLTPGLALTITASTTFVPGGPDPRTLGVQVDQLGCRPVGSSVVLPPRHASWAAAVAAAALGAGLGLTGVTAGSAVLGTVLIAAAQTVPLSAGAAPYTDYPDTLVRLAAWIALLMVIALKLVEASNRQALRNTARFVVVFSAGAIYLKLGALLHPSRPVVDALFHAHRLEWVLAGRYYFTQLSTSATPFPYAIGLYVFAAPWSVLTHNYVTLLRIVVCASEAIAGALLYLMVVRARGDRIMGAMAVALFNLVPLSYVIVGNGNLTHAFGQSVALATIAAATIWPSRPRQIGRFAAMVLLATLGFIAHISTVILLLATLLALWFFYRFLGGPAMRAPARFVVLAAAVALVFSVVLYWGHFGKVYDAQLTRVRAVAAAKAAPPPPAAVSPQSGGGSATPVPALGHSMIPLPLRAVDAVRQTVGNIGWPILILALVGAWRLWVDGGRDRLVFAVAAWSAVGLGFVGLSVLTAVDVRYQQDAWEFIGRVEHTTCPAAVILAAAGATWAWSAGRVARLASWAVLLAAVVIGFRAWAGWL